MQRAMALLVLAAVAGGPAGIAAGAAEDLHGGLPAGPGREETFDACSPCHSIRLVVQQRLTREDWNEVLDDMVAEHDMPEIEEPERKRILDYLGARLGRHVPR